MTVKVIEHSSQEHLIEKVSSVLIEEGNLRVWIDGNEEPMVFEFDAVDRVEVNP
jgi:hypothetical protein